MKASILLLQTNLRAHSRMAAGSLVAVLCLVSLAMAIYLSGLRDDRAAGRTEQGATHGRDTPAESAAENPTESPGPVAQAANVPALLSETDAAHYRLIFSLQKQGDFAAARAFISRLDDTLLMGHVEAQRLQHTARPKTAELKHWLLEYADHPDALWIHRLVKRRLPRKLRKSIKSLPRQTGLAVVPAPPPPYVSKKNLTRKQRRRVSRIKRAIRIWLRRGKIRQTERLLRRGYVIHLLDRYEMDDARSRIAAARFYQGHETKAYKLAAMAITGSGGKLPMTHWIAGLSAWKMGKIEQALGHFETLALTEDRSGWIRAGAALWAARAQGRLGNDDAAQEWFEQAARYPHTLYGVMALAALNRPLPFAAPDRQIFTAPMAELLASDMGGRRALALAEIGEVGRAEQELLAIREWNRPDMRAALRAVSGHLGIHSIPLKLVRRARASDPGISVDQPLDPSLYPFLPWKPDAGSGIDQALLLAFMRQESSFNASALSPAGALGLMQLMPATAKFLNKGRRFRGTKRLDWADPAINVGLGQRYLTYLRKHRLVRNDLLRLIAAYNSGPGNVAYWVRKKIRESDDPLLFMESIPNLETRLFVRRVLANLWIYRHRLEQRAPSLEAFAAGHFPRYHSIDNGAKKADFADMRPPAKR
ncbi:MAG: lytic transglycosylase domain-containing protein [Rhodospirillaceae bacterium]|nr:lytic transglycosylase domain-containing protein [Rhodospirillaceae bacterium]